MRCAKEKSALLSAVFFSVITIYIIASTVRTFYWGDDLTTTAYVLQYIGFLGLTITAFLKNKQAIFIASSITILSFVLFDIDHLFWWGTAFFSFLNILDVLFEILPYAMFMIVIFLSSKGDKKVKHLWFLPSVLRLITQLFWYGWQWIMFLHVFALFFAGLWLRDDLTLITFPSLKKDVQTNSISTSNVNDAEKLKRLKDLLDSGAVTQEEFDAKKKEILK